MKSRVFAAAALAALAIASTNAGDGPPARAPLARAVPTLTPLAIGASAGFLHRPEVCYAAGTSPDVVRQNERRRALMSSLQGQAFQFADTDRWTSTATNGSGLTQGQVTTITWNIVPDGTSINGFNLEPAAPSNLKAFLNGIYGSEATWLAHFQSVFDQWGALTGVTYVKETADDGSPLAFNPGVLGVRADVRIGGHFIDGNFNVLAYNFFPNTGDMVIDTGDSYYSSPTGGLANSSLGFRNMLAHEHGHGLGFSHSCPINDTKLMEPFLSTVFVHAQLDDKLAGWRGYGDDKENNETSGTASDLGALGNGTTTLNEVSVDDDADVDFYKFTVAAGKRAAVTLTPIGSTYLAGPQNGDGSCSAGTSFNALTIQNLGVELRNTDGASILASATAAAAGVAENIPATSLVSAGTYFVRAFSSTAVNNVQGYQLQVTISDDVSSFLSINDVALTEGTGGTTSAIFTVTRSGSTAGTSSVTAQAANNTALAPSDYTATGPTVLNFGVGVTTQTFSVPVVGDTADELAETFFVNLSAASGASITDNQGVGTINDDDAQPTLSINDVAVTEGNAGPVVVGFTVTLSAASGQTVTVSAATANNTAISPGDYTAVGATTLTFNPGVTTQTFNVNALGDTLDETNETFFVNLSGATNAGISDNQGLGTINDDDAQPTLSINDVVVTEGNAGPVVVGFTVTLSAASGQTVTVSAATANNTAVSPGDYTAVGATTLTFNAGVTTQSFNVNALGDTLDEVNETFFVNLSASSNAGISDNQGLGTINDDDAQPTLSINNVTVTEGNAGPVVVGFTVTLSAASGQTVTVSAATANDTALSPGDYTAIGATTLTFNPGVTTQSFNVNALGDTLDELNETFFVNLSAASNAGISDNQGLGTINDDDAQPTLSINDVAVTEGNAGPVVVGFTVTLSAASGQTVTVSAATANNTAVSPGDYTAVGATTLTFNPGVTTQTFNVNALGDTLDETNETFFVNLSAASNAGISDNQGIGTINDDDAQPTLSINDVTVTEGNAGPVVVGFTVTLSAASGQTVTVSAATANNTAVSPGDYTAVGATTLTFNPGVTTQSFNVNALGDTLDELNETFFVNLSAATNAGISDAQGAGAITDDDATPTLSINDVTVTEGNAGPVVAGFTVTLSAASGQTVTVSAATANNTAVTPGDYTAVGATTLTFNPGVTTQSFNVNALGDTLDELNETFFVNLSSATNAGVSDAQGLGTINDDDAQPTLSINDVAVTEGNAGPVVVGFTVTLSAASGQTVTVSAATANNTATAPGDYTAVGATTLTFNPGVTTQAFNVNALGDTLDEVNETFFVNLSSASGATITDAQGIGTINDDDAQPTLSINDVAVTEGNAGPVVAGFTVTLSAASGQTVTVSAATANNTAVSPGDYTAVGATTLTFNPGVTTQSFNVNALGDTLDEPNETFFVNLSAATNAGISDAQGAGTITDDDATPTLSINNVAVTEGNVGPVVVGFTVSLSAASGQTVTVSAATANNTALSPGDYTAVGATTLTFNPGVTTQSFNVNALGDTLDELNETFFVNLSGATNAGISDNQGIGTINDDDAQPTLSINNVTVTEGNAGPVVAGFTVTLSAASGQTVTVSAATANNSAVSPGDYTAVGATTLTFNPGDLTKTFAVPVAGDVLDELNETFHVNLTSPANATISDNQGLGTITDDDEPPSFNFQDATVTEGNSGSIDAVFPVTLSAASGLTVTVTVETTDSDATAGSDYVATGPVVLTFNPGEIAKTVTVPVLGDVAVEGHEFFEVSWTVATNATPGAGTGIGEILDDDLAARTFVSEAGSDANDCSLQTTPCRNISAAIAQVLVDGEVIILTTGEYQGTLIRHGVKLTSASGTVAFIRNPFSISAPGSRVALRGLTLKGDGTGVGISIGSVDSVSLEDMTIDRWLVGVRLTNDYPRHLALSNSIVRNNGTGIECLDGAGTRGSIVESRFERNTTGISILNGAFQVSDSAFVAHWDSGISVAGGAVDIQRSQFSANWTAVVALAGTARVGRSHIFGNGVGFSIGGGSTFQSYGTNVLRGNGINSTGPIATIPEQ